MRPSHSRNNLSATPRGRKKRAADPHHQQHHGGGGGGVAAAGGVADRRAVELRANNHHGGLHHHHHHHRVHGAARKQRAADGKLLSAWSTAASSHYYYYSAGQHGQQQPSLQLLASLASAAATIEPIEMEPNASRFAIFAAVRAAVLESDAKLMQILCNSSGGGTGVGAGGGGGGGVGSGGSGAGSCGAGGGRSAGDLAGALLLAGDGCCLLCAAACREGNDGLVPDCRCHALLIGGRAGGIKSADDDESDDNTFFSDVSGGAEMGAKRGGADGGDRKGGNHHGFAASYVDVVPPMLVPQIVGAGLRGLFELISEARTLNAALCTRALRALFDVIQGQVPEAFRAEPADMIQPLYELLLELATMPPQQQPPQTSTTTATPAASTSSSSASSMLNIFGGSHSASSHQQHHQQPPIPNNTDINTNNWSALGCSALLGLCIARGNTGSTLRAIAALLMSPATLAHQNIQQPLVLGSLQRSIVAVAVGHPLRPDYLRDGVPERSLLVEFVVPEATGSSGTTTQTAAAMASAGNYIYLLLTGRGGLLKIGSGFGGTLAGFVYARNDELGRDASDWIGMCGGTLYYKKMTKRTPANDTLHIIDQQTLLVRGTVTTRCPRPVGSGALGSGLLFSDGDALFAICASTQSSASSTTTPPATAAAPLQHLMTSASSASLSTTPAETLAVRLVHVPATVPGVAGKPMPPNDMSAIGPYMSELPLKLARRNFRTLGYACFEEEMLSADQIKEVRVCWSSAQLLSIFVPFLSVISPHPPVSRSSPHTTRSSRVCPPVRRPATPTSPPSWPAKSSDCCARRPVGFSSTAKRLRSVSRRSARRRPSSPPKLSSARRRASCRLPSDTMAFMRFWWATMAAPILRAQRDAARTVTRRRTGASRRRPNRNGWRRWRGILWCMRRAIMGRRRL